MLRFPLVFFLSLLFSFSTHAARIIEVNVTSEHDVGSTRAQSVEVKILIDKNDPALKLSLQTLLITGDNKDKLKPLLVRPLSTELPRAGKEPVALVTRVFRVALAGLDLPNGEVKIGYVASAYGAESAERMYEMASALQTVEVEGKKRTVREEPRAIAEDSVAVKPFVFDREGKRKDTEETVTVFPSRAKDGSITIEEQQARLAAIDRNQPQALAGARTDIVQALAMKEDNLVYFATNRKYLPVRGQQRRFTFLAETRAKGIAGLSWGAVEVQLPTREQEQSWWSKVKATTGDVFIWGENETLASLSNSTSKDVFMFIHGYCVSFEDVVLQAGRMKRDLQFKGNVMAFSWPSAGSMRKYDEDEAHAEDDTELAAFDHVLQRVVERAKSQGGRVYILAHSMGNRFLVHGMRQLYLSSLGKELAAQPKADRTLAMVVFAAPDVDINLFGSVLPNVGALTKLSSFYYSTKDKALGLSHAIHNITRAGLHPSFNDEVATVNTDKVAGGWFSVGHSYYSSSDRAILDLYLQIHYHRLPALRIPPLEEDKETKKKRLFEHWYLTVK